MPTLGSIVQNGIVLGGDAGLGQGVEEGRLADVGQADDAALEGHGIPFSRAAL
jgi:hypothetical protein